MVSRSVSVDVSQMVAALDALADETRLGILARLRERDQCVCHLVEELGLKQSVVSHHIGVLRRAGLVASWQHPVDRRWLYYRLDRARLDRVASDLAWLADAAGYNTEPLPCAADREARR